MFDVSGEMARGTVAVAKTGSRGSNLKIAESSLGMLKKMILNVRESKSYIAQTQNQENFLNVFTTPLISFHFI